MKNFCKKLTIFLLPIFILGLAMEYSLRSIPNEYSYKKKYLDEHASEIETLVLGSSHSFFDVMPVYIDGNSFNVAHVSQTYDLDLEIFEKYKDSLVNLKTIILPVSYFSYYSKLSNDIESWREKNYVLYYNMPRHFSFKTHTEIFSNSFYINVWRIYAFITKENVLSCSRFGWGNTYKTKKSKDLEKSGVIAAKRHTVDNNLFFKDNLNYLEEIIEICKNKDVKVILFTPPAYKSYRNHLNYKQLNSTIIQTKKLVSLYPNSEYFNLIADSLFLEEDFYDSDHLNEKGAKKLSKLLNKEINTLNKEK